MRNNVSAVAAPRHASTFTRKVKTVRYLLFLFSAIADNDSQAIARLVNLFTLIVLTCVLFLITALDPRRAIQCSRTRDRSVQMTMDAEAGVSPSVARTEHAHAHHHHGIQNPRHVIAAGAEAAADIRDNVKSRTGALIGGAATSATTGPTTSQRMGYNTNNLALRLAADATSAATAGALVAPVITMIDK